MWAPYTNEKVEAVQRIAARLVTSNFGFTNSVTAMLEYLKLSYFSGTLILAIFVGKDLACFYFNDLTEN